MAIYPFSCSPWVEGVGVGCVADSFLEELECPSGSAVTRAQVSVGRYVYQIMLHSVEHAESVVSSSYFEWLLFKVI